MQIGFAPALAPILLGLLGAASAPASAGEWSLLLEPMYMDAFGHDQHVLTIHERDLGSTPTVDTRTPVTLDTDNGIAPRIELQYSSADWTLGLDFFWFDSSQGRPSRSAAASAPGGLIDEIVFEAADRSFTSDDPGEVLIFGVLEDTDIIAWTVDLYALRTLAQTPASGLQLQFGLRNADFDNDFHSAVGIENVGGTLFDASSNYPRMIGPLVGLVAQVQFARSSIRGYLGQSVVFGTAELSNDSRDFIGPVSETPTVVAVETFHKEQDVAIPITEFRINWLYPIGKHVALGVSANASVWWDVPVPPGLIPVADGNQVFHENTILYFGLALALKLKI